MAFFHKKIKCKKRSIVVIATINVTSCSTISLYTFTQQLCSLLLMHVDDDADPERKEKKRIRNDYRSHNGAIYFNERAICNEKWRRNIKFIEKIKNVDLQQFLMLVLELEVKQIVETDSSAFNVYIE